MIKRKLPKLNWYIVKTKGDNALTSTDAYLAHKRWAKETWKGNKCEVVVL